MGRLADRPAARSRMRRRAFPIRAYCGPNGTGKSALMVYDNLLNLESGRPSLSTVRLLDYRNPGPCPGGPTCDDPPNHSREAMESILAPFDPEDPFSPVIRLQRPTGRVEVHRKAHPLYVKFTDYRQLTSWTDGDILMDEIVGIANSRDSAGGMPTQVQNVLMQLRRRNVSLAWSAPAWGRADKIIREVSQLVTLTTASLPKRAPADGSGQPRLWYQRRLFFARSYDPQMMDEFEAHRAMQDQLESLITAAYWGPGSTMFDGYDTYEAVSTLGWSSDSGMCMTCAGKRTVPRCSCDDHAKVGARRQAKPEPNPAPVAV